MKVATGILLLAVGDEQRDHAFRDDEAVERTVVGRRCRP
ncbi:hypothetical protein C8E87_0145 [Paractinoplanes brasiliensis]|uniref:Uncharacterized protein n=1 Tax=Paractinoplanes brasiliensis TaxID=52695 RepID=A0A4V3C779_9ACTN|nr:hypothetical protein C8E87_0145 [Actinoplanes brasiliensis]